MLAVEAQKAGSDSDESEGDFDSQGLIGVLELPYSVLYVFGCNPQQLSFSGEGAAVGQMRYVVSPAWNHSLEAASSNHSQPLSAICLWSLIIASFSAPPPRRSAVIETLRFPARPTRDEFLANSSIVKRLGVGEKA